eukprot:CAMPEP_0168422324 /NCGR_PEP_ID=MMETSP0228-20121227/33736_1 /TAXON_ID=133427 /ORGANISM="Protoceratium reticulatum, Strain CCCM 535 (=CCMP 1889)" /LENGTH=150 /DNA_ID=CAMNT_0008436255 /DNA_START=52 /DNA_END=504 /DNA_ORIENTATION=+
MVAIRAAARRLAGPVHCPTSRGTASVCRQVDQAARIIEVLGMTYPAFMLSKQRCLPCIKAKKLLRELGVRCQVVQLDGLSNNEKLAMQAHIKAATGAGSVPRVYVGGVCLGGFNQVQRKHWAGELVPALVAAGAAEDGTGAQLDTWNPLL